MRKSTGAARKPIATGPIAARPIAIRPVGERGAAPAAEKSLLSLSDAAYDAIKERILSLALRPGLFVTEQALCEMVGISRMPVHQAVQRLKADGLLDVIARKGIVIRMTSFKELLDLFEARLMVEPGIAALAAERAAVRRGQEVVGWKEHSTL